MPSRSPISQTDEHRPLLVAILAHEDDFRVSLRLRNHLNGLVRQGAIRLWSDESILPGDNPGAALDGVFSSAQIILFLVSSSSMGVNGLWCDEFQKNAEVAAANEKQRFIPVLVTPYAWQESGLGQFKILPVNRRPISQWKDEDEPCREIAQVIVVLTKAIRRLKADGESASKTSPSKLSDKPDFTDEQIVTKYWGPIKRKTLQQLASDLLAKADYLMQNRVSLTMADLLAVKTELAHIRLNAIKLLSGHQQDMFGSTMDLVEDKLDGLMRQTSFPAGENVSFMAEIRTVTNLLRSMAAILF